MYSPGQWEGSFLCYFLSLPKLLRLLRGCVPARSWECFAFLLAVWRRRGSACGECHWIHAPMAPSRPRRAGRPWPEGHRRLRHGFLGSANETCSHSSRAGQQQRCRAPPAPRGPHPASRVSASADAGGLHVAPGAVGPNQRQAAPWRVAQHHHSANGSCAFLHAVT